MIKDKKINEMLNQHPGKLLFKLGLPAVITALFNEVNGIIDAIFMGQFLGEEAVSSMAIIFPFLICVSAIAFLFSEGAGIAIGRYLGAKEIDQANKTFGNTISITVLSGVILGALSYFLFPMILDFFHLSEKAYYFADIYIKIFSLGLPIIMFSVVLSKAVYTEGYSGFILKVTGIQLIFNVVINYLFLGVFGFGIIGVAIATIISMIIQCAILIRFIQSDKMVLSVNKEAMKMKASYFKEVIPLGMPTFLTMLLLSLTLGIESKVISDFGGTALSVQTITGYLFSATSSVSSGIMGASLILMSYSVGAKDVRRFFQIFRLSLVVVFISTLIMNLPLITNSQLVARAFTDSQNLLKLIQTPAFIYGITAPFIFTTNVILYAMQPVGMENTATVIFSLQQIVLFIPLLFILRPFGFDYAIAAQPFSEVIGGVITLIIIPAFFAKVKKYFARDGNRTLKAV